MGSRLEFRIRSDTGYLPFVRSIADHAVNRMGLAHADDRWVSNLKIALVEAVNNAIIHAHKRNADIPVKIVLRLKGEMLTIDVHDRGKGFTMPPFEFPPLERTHGRGLFLMRSVMESVECKKTNGGNIVRMRCPIPGGRNMKKAKIEVQKTHDGRMLDILYDLSRAITSATVLEDVCDKILAKAMSFMSVSKGSIMKYDPEDGTLKIIAAHGIPKDVVRSARVKVGEGISGQVFASSMPLLVRDIKTQPLAAKRSHYKTRSLISAPVTCFPMKVIDAPVGVINMTDKKDGGVFTESDLKLLTIIANQLAAYLHIFDLASRLRSSERMKRDLEIAREIQSSFLPARVPKMKGVEAAGACLMAERVGGDYYDFLAGGWASPAFVIADVSGHDVGAAMLMAAFRTALRSEAGLPILPPAVIVKRLNAMLFDDLIKAEQFISMVYLQYQPSSGVVRYTNAGHNPPLLFKSEGGRFCELTTDDPLIGIERGEHFHESRVAVKKGDVIVLYTDGAVEARDSKGARFGLRRLKGVISKNAQKSAQKIVDAICSSVNSFSGGKLCDDVTVVTIKIK